MEKPTEEQIRQRAHELWEQNHRPDGRDDEFWHQAEKELNGGITPTEKSETFLEWFCISASRGIVQEAIGSVSGPYFGKSGPEFVAGASVIAPALCKCSVGRGISLKAITESQIADPNLRIDNFDEIDDLSHPLYKNGWSNGTFTRKIHQNWLFELIEPSQLRRISRLSTEHSEHLKDSAGYEHFRSLAVYFGDSLCLASSFILGYLATRRADAPWQLLRLRFASAPWQFWWRQLSFLRAP
jgi:Protein of unknown function (DUF2934)